MIGDRLRGNDEEYDILLIKKAQNNRTFFAQLKLNIVVGFLILNCNDPATTILFEKEKNIRFNLRYGSE